MSFDEFLKNNFFTEFIRYSSSQTILAVDSDDLATFSTSSDYNDTLDEQFQRVFGSNADFDSVVSGNDADYEIDSYDDLIQKVIALEMQRLIESGTSNTIYAISQNELGAFCVVDYTEPLGLSFDPATRSQINNVILDCYSNIEPVTAEKFTFKS